MNAVEIKAVLDQIRERSQIVIIEDEKGRSGPLNRDIARRPRSDVCRANKP